MRTRVSISPDVWKSTGWLLPALGMSILTIAVLLTEKSVKDAWILQSIVPAFVVFGILLGLGLMLGQSRLAEASAAIAVGLLAVVPSLKYGFVYGEFDSIGHYGTAFEILRTGSLTLSGKYGETYAGTPVLHILLATIALIAGIPTETAIVYVLFLEHFVILVLVIESIRRIFPQIEMRTIIFISAVTLPVIFLITGTTFGLLPIAMLTYVFSTGVAREPKKRVLLTAVLMFSLVFSHFVTTVYFMTFLGGYTISLVVARLIAGSRGATRNHLIESVPFFFTFFILWLVYAGVDYIYATGDLISVFFLGSHVPPTTWEFPLTDVIQLFVFKYARLIFSVLLAVTTSSIALLRYRRTEAFAVFWWLLASSMLLGAIVVLGWNAETGWRFLAYASLTTPYFLCLLISRLRNRFSVPDISRIRVINAMMLATLVLSMIAVYPMTPLYPESGGSPILDDNSVNSIYAVTALEHFRHVYSSGPVITSVRIQWQLLSLAPELIPLEYYVISSDLERVTSPAELRGQLVLFDSGGRSGTATIAMRALTPQLRDTPHLDIVYSNSLFFIGLAT